MEESKNLIAYCFLAALSDNQKDLYNKVYIPICKISLNKISEKGITHGSDKNVQEMIYDIYGLKIPMIIIHKMLQTVNNNFSQDKKNKNNFKLFENGKSFEISKYGFYEFENIYEKEARNANALQNAFEEFLKSNDSENISSVQFSKFIDKNKKILISYFSENKIINGNDFDDCYLYHIEFLKFIEHNNHILYKIAENIFLGSIIAAYFESGLNLESKFKSGEIYYFDTQLILEVLDIQNELDTQPILDLIKIIKDTGGQIKVLNITLDECYFAIDNALQNYASYIYPSNTIYDACIRKNKNKNWLINLNSNLENILKKEFGITKENISIDLIEKFKKTEDVKKLKSLGNNQFNAEHDVIAYLYVRKMRVNGINVFQKAKYWFVTANYNLYKFNSTTHIHNSINEIIMPEFLVSLLWLKDPVKHKNYMKKIGLNEIISETMKDEMKYYYTFEI